MATSPISDAASRFGNPASPPRRPQHPSSNSRPSASPNRRESPRAPSGPRTTMPDTSPPGIPLDDGILVALEGKCVDEFGNILDWDGTVLGRAEGDLPSMVGRPVAKGGSILDAAGDLAGRVAEVLPPALTPEGESGRKKLKRDHRGNIYDQFGNVVGRMRTNSGGGSKATGVDDGDRGDSGFSSRGETGATGARPEGADETAALDPLPATPSPSEIYLDVKSTHDGIQLVIKIPTVFNGRHETMQCNVER